MRRPVLLLGLAAATVSIVAALLIRVVPAWTSVFTTLHLLLTLGLFTTAGAVVARRGGSGWRAGLAAGGTDALIGHPIAFALSTPPSADAVPMPAGSAMSPEPIVASVETLHVVGAFVGALSAVILAVIAATIGAWLVRRRVTQG